MLWLLTATDLVRLQHWHQGMAQAVSAIPEDVLDKKPQLPGSPPLPHLSGGGGVVVPGVTGHRPGRFLARLPGLGGSSGTNVYILTAGEWGGGGARGRGRQNSHTVIQMVSFGHSKVGLERLQLLDDELLPPPPQSVVVVRVRLGHCRHEAAHSGRWTSRRTPGRSAAVWPCRTQKTCCLKRSLRICRERKIPSDAAARPTPPEVPGTVDHEPGPEAGSGQPQGPAPVADPRAALAFRDRQWIHALLAQSFQQVASE
ncbi:hypothetical protein GGTG_12508 [Gaeumannomyces tritici R3-111a-1]|uniref:Uncharacterized protein n=1 Tax=Gaeumannomyces tritici (strain R3-111a-1) TaxID=644352 RepID=J3PG84_GAET3|nr:hypothetical protein GGTG_12508 [Gaeumannomyces tritici R3-111a-1]EJT69624.1 hypothetical protein GGTG_12508 [Gaeumannomyces tritici R3-111a-1]